ncbi:hypothetical protein, partial [Methylobacterium frigidaeris]|uniref:hypothetical protein n=1 Tax=Methylobacterium frigidaeris TaxID=2038277 RepID=UPI001A9C69D2
MAGFDQALPHDVDPSGLQRDRSPDPSVVDGGIGDPRSGSLPGVGIAGGAAERGDDRDDEVIPRAKALAVGLGPHRALREGGAIDGCRRLAGEDRQGEHALDPLSVSRQQENSRCSVRLGG